MGCSAYPNSAADRAADHSTHKRGTCRIRGWRGCGLSRRRCSLLRLLPPDGRRRTLHRSDDRKPLVQQCVMLQFVEISASWIAPCRLPALDRAACIIVEIAVRLAFEVAERRQPPLNIATLTWVESELVFGLTCRQRGVDGRRIND